ncbi:hypothetical protein BH09VER1_BH09VER1_28730 [soil metagenome]
MKDLLYFIGLGLPWVGLPLLIIVLILAAILLREIWKGTTPPPACWEVAYDDERQMWMVQWSEPDASGDHLQVAAFYTRHFAQCEALDMNHAGRQISEYLGQP